MEPSSVALAHARLAEVLETRGKYTKAALEFERAVALLESRAGPSDMKVVFRLIARARCTALAGDPEVARALAIGAETRLSEAEAIPAPVSAAFDGLQEMLRAGR